MNQTLPEVENLTENATIVASYFILQLPTPLVLQLDDFLEPVTGSLKDIKQPFFLNFIQLLTEHMVNFFLLEPMDLLSVNQLGKKLTQVCATTSIKVSKFVSYRLYQKTSDENVAIVMKYWQSIYQKDLPDAYFKLRLTPEFAMQFHITMKNCITSDGTESIEQVLPCLETLAKFMIETLFLKPTNQLKLTKLQRKLIDAGVLSVIKTVQAIIHQVIKHFSAEQLSTLMRYYGQIYQGSPEAT